MTSVSKSEKSGVASTLGSQVGKSALNSASRGAIQRSPKDGLKVVETRGLQGKVGITVADGSPTMIDLLKKGAIQGIFFQEAVGQGIDGTQQVYNALTGAPVTQNMALVMPLVTADKVDSSEAQKVISRVFPPSN